MWSRAIQSYSVIALTLQLEPTLVVLWKSFIYCMKHLNFRTLQAHHVISSALDLRGTRTCRDISTGDWRQHTRGSQMYLITQWWGLSDLKELIHIIWNIYFIEIQCDIMNVELMHNSCVIIFITFMSVIQGLFCHRSVANIMCTSLNVMASTEWTKDSVSEINVAKQMLTTSCMSASIT